MIEDFFTFYTIPYKYGVSKINPLKILKKLSKSLKNPLT
ncbi:hypothetical protein INS83_04620 [Vagococcus salmoninarum]|nr:hypothetical protein [Vagococcus salmoninarum]